MFVFAALGIVVAAAIGAWAYVVSNVEQPKYSIVSKDAGLDSDIELRDYPALVVAEVTRRGDRNSAVRAGFGPLAAYIFAKDRAGDSVSMTAPVMQQREIIAMTAPVTQTPTGAEENTWAIRFVMPAKYTLETLPKAAGVDVRLLQIAPARRAAIRFSGVATDASIAANEAKLRQWLAAQNLEAISAATYAYYNDPFTPGPLRRNEVMIDVKTK
jgi:SOUL heme-binding protein